MPLHHCTRPRLPRALLVVHPHRPALSRLSSDDRSTEARSVSARSSKFVFLMCREAAPYSKTKSIVPTSVMRIGSTGVALRMVARLAVPNHDYQKQRRLMNPREK